jgi:hypothetical protein
VEKGKLSLVRIGGDWFLVSLDTTACGSMADALNAWFSDHWGGNPLGVLGNVLGTLGITLADCAKENLPATLKLVTSACGNVHGSTPTYSYNGHHHRSSRKLIDSLGEFPQIQEILTRKLAEL